MVSGALYNAVWNSLTGKPCGFGTKDIDLFYFDASDLSYEAEDAVIARAATHFAGLPLPVEVRNQARVHLWFEQRFGAPLSQASSSSADALTRFASTDPCGRRQAACRRHSSISSRRSASTTSSRSASSPNRAIDNRATHEEKAARARRQWPEITVIPW